MAGRSSDGWPIWTGWMGMQSPVYGDFDTLYAGTEIILVVPCIRVFPFDVWTLIYARHADGSFMVGWDPRRIDDGSPGDVPALGDIDNDGALELVLALTEELIQHRYVTALEADGSRVSGRWPVDTGDGVTCSPVIDDFDGDGRVEIVQPVAGTGLIERIRLGVRSADPRAMVWPM